MATAKRVKTLPLSHLNDKPHIRNYGPMATKPSISSKSKKTTKKGK